MKRVSIILLLLIVNLAVKAQVKKDTRPAKRPFLNSDKVNFNGQWRGGFEEIGSGFSGYVNDPVDYVLELECSGHMVSGYSYTYFFDGSKRYYTICKVTGTLNRFTKEITVTEYERTKYNTPPDFPNCFQVHKLKYEKIGSDTERLIGRWYPAPDQKGDCGSGTTALMRIISKKRIPLNNTIASASKKQIGKSPLTVQKKNKIVSTIAPKVEKIKKDTIVISKDTTAHIINPDQNLNILPLPNYKERENIVLNSIDIEQELVTVDFYDNGEVDGDSISVFFNGKLIVSHLMLSEKAASFTLSIDRNRPYNELIMYAENLGTIPPNTALMVVKDGKKQYNVHITSDTEKNGTIYFHYKGAGKKD
jgi:archaellum component FlaF (FlaF/FlaG flagellin family)